MNHKLLDEGLSLSELLAFTENATQNCGRTNIDAIALEAISAILF
jgi:hypothetical protein